jgi:2-hydroxychromene-2-carboxylate isomerase
MPGTLEFWFDLSCPYAYLASRQVEAVAARTGAALALRPMLLGGVFAARAVPQRLFASYNAARLAHQADDLRRLAAMARVPLAMHPGHPVRTVDALRAMLAAGEPFGPLMHRLYRAYWVEHLDLADGAVLARLLAAAGHDAPAVLARAASPGVKAELRDRTDAAIARGIFGAPTFVVGDALFFGQDRLDLAELALGGQPTRPPVGRPGAPVELFFDYASPFAYLAAARAEAELGAAVRWRPMLLGGVFRRLGTPDVPFFEQGEAKQRHTRDDLARQARRAGVPFAWPSRFPLPTLLALRVTLLAGDGPAGRALIQRLFAARWAEDRDVSDPAVVRAIADDCGLDGRALVEAAAGPAAKEALREATDAALAAGVFGAPTFLVHHPDGRRGLYWGADRLELAARAAAGDARAA